MFLSLQKKTILISGHAHFFRLPCFEMQPFFVLFDQLRKLENSFGNFKKNFLQCDQIFAFAKKNHTHIWPRSFRLPCFEVQPFFVLFDQLRKQKKIHLEIKKNSFYYVIKSTVF